MISAASIHVTDLSVCDNGPTPTGGGGSSGGEVNNRKKNKTQACSTCHKSKNKCVYTPINGSNERPLKCDRCARLNKECFPHVSRQGRKRNVKEVGEEDAGGCDTVLSNILRTNNLTTDIPVHITENISVESSARRRSSSINSGTSTSLSTGVSSSNTVPTNVEAFVHDATAVCDEVLPKETDGIDALIGAATTAEPEIVIQEQITRECAEHCGAEQRACLKSHYGVLCLIREWVSIAFVRRSFALLGKACTLASRCEISMDQALCGIVRDEEGSGKRQGKKKPHSLRSDTGGRMNYLLSLLLEPRESHVLPIDKRNVIVPSSLPTSILSLLGVHTLSTFRDEEIGNRWIVIREICCGVARFFVSPAFGRNVMSWTHASQLYEDNICNVMDTVFVEEDFTRFLGCFSHQLTLHAKEGMAVQPVHAPKMKIRLIERQWKKNVEDWSDESLVTKEMIELIRKGQVDTLEMDFIFACVPTMDKVTCYLEFFHRCDNESSTLRLGGEVYNPVLSGLSVASEASDDEALQLNPPTFDEMMEREEWAGVDDIAANISGDAIDDFIKSLLD
jgi:hypothetical protein